MAKKETASTGIDISQIDFPKIMNLRTAAIFLEISESRVRTLAKDEELSSFKNEAGHWQFDKGDLTTFKENMGTRKGGYRRGDRKYWRVQIKHTDMEAVVADLAKYGIEVENMYQYERDAAAEKGGKAKKVKEEKKEGIFS